MKGEEDQLTTFMHGNWGTCMNSIHDFFRGGGGGKAKMCFSKGRLGFEHGLLPNHQFSPTTPPPSNTPSNQEQSLRA